MQRMGMQVGRGLSLGDAIHGELRVWKSSSLQGLPSVLGAQQPGHLLGHCFQLHVMLM